MIEFRRYHEKDVKDFHLAAKKCYPRHMVFDNDIDIVKEYIKKKDNDKFGGFFFAYIKEKCVGGCFLETEIFDAPRSHARFKYNHLVALDQELKVKLIQLLDSKISNLIMEGKFNSAKVEVSLADSERDFKQDLKLFSKAGYKVEGTLKDHYRLNEDVVVLGKIF
jgi:hypothetical protein